MPVVVSPIRLRRERSEDPPCQGSRRFVALRVTGQAVAEPVTHPASSGRCPGDNGEINVNEQSADMPELVCPICGYNIVVQVLRRSDRCPECGFILPVFDPEPRDTLEERWEEMATAVRKWNRRGFSDGLQVPWRGLGKSKLEINEG